MYSVQLLVYLNAAFETELLVIKDLSEDGQIRSVSEIYEILAKLDIILGRLDMRICGFPGLPLLLHQFVPGTFRKIYSHMASLIAQTFS